MPLQTTRKSTFTWPYIFAGKTFSSNKLSGPQGKNRLNLLCQLGCFCGLMVACWITDPHHPCSNLGMGISEGCFIYLVYKSGRKTLIIIFLSQLGEQMDSLSFDASVSTLSLNSVVLTSK